MAWLAGATQALDTAALRITHDPVLTSFAGYGLATFGSVHTSLSNIADRLVVGASGSAGLAILRDLGRAHSLSCLLPIFLAWLAILPLACFPQVGSRQSMEIYLRSAAPPG